VCHKNAPVVNRLYNVIQGDPVLAKNVKLMAIAMGNDQKQVDVFKAQFRAAYPIFPDKEGKVYFAVEKPSTPTMIMVTPGGKVLMSHGGLITDFDGLLKELREIQKKQ
jgi:hypothetical protein